jgi:hypothetical protein
MLAVMRVENIQGIALVSLQNVARHSELITASAL